MLTFDCVRRKWNWIERRKQETRRKYNQNQMFYSIRKMLSLDFDTLNLKLHLSAISLISQFRAFIFRFFSLSFHFTQMFSFFLCLAFLLFAARLCNVYIILIHFDDTIFSIFIPIHLTTRRRKSSACLGGWSNGWRRRHTKARSNWMNGKKK